MATVKQRIIAGTGAFMFFISIIALTVVVIVSMIQENNQDSSQVPASTETEAQEGQLRGSKLAEFEPVAKVAELQTTDIVEGEGAEITSINDTVTAHYTGALASDGTIFESSLDSGEPFTAQLTGVIEGWQEGMIGMKEGGKRRLIIPAEKAYGEAGSGSIPPNSALVFDIELQKVAR